MSHLGDTTDCFPYGNNDHGQNPYWVYVCNTLSDGRVSFEEASEAVAFLAGQYIADQCHEERARIIAKEQEDDATELTVAT